MTFKEVCKLMAADGFVHDRHEKLFFWAFVNTDAQQRCVVHDQGEGNWTLYTFDRNLKKEPQ